MHDEFSDFSTRTSFTGLQLSWNPAFATVELFSLKNYRRNLNTVKMESRISDNIGNRIPGFIIIYEIVINHREIPHEAKEFCSQLVALLAYL